jgi:flagellar basal-body rod protein FlgB
MPASLEAITTAALVAALGTAGQRHAASAANIANANVEGYVAQKISFDDHLEDARATLARGERLDATALDALRAPVLLAPAGDADVSVQLDAEMSELARNAVQFQTLAQGLSRHLSILALAASDGRR